MSIRDEEMITLRIEAREAIAGLERAKGNLKNSLFAALVRSTALVRETVIENIRSGQKKNLGRPPFAPSTIARKSKRGRSLMGLVDSGRMMTSIHESVSKTSLKGEVFPGVDYLIFHEVGTRKMPERPTFKPVPNQVNNKITDIFKTEVARALYGL